MAPNVRWHRSRGTGHPCRRHDDAQERRRVEEPKAQHPVRDPFDHRVRWPALWLLVRFHDGMGQSGRHYLNRRWSCGLRRIHIQASQAR